MGYMYADLSLGYLGVGDLDKAKQTAILAVEKSTEGKLQKGYALDCLAQIEAQASEWERAKEHFEESITLLTEAETRLFLVRSRFHYAVNLVKHEDFALAASIMNNVENVFTQLNLTPEAEAAHTLMKAIASAA